MNDIFKKITRDVTLTGDIRKDSYDLLMKHNKIIIANHSLRVTEKAKLLAKQFGVNENLAEVAGLLHDISGVYPNEEKLELCKKLNIEILLEEERFPMILHQKISRVMATEIFNISNEEILEAISCHTTLRSNASPLDMVLFIADKIEWDQKGLPPYIDEVEKALNTSLELSTFKFIKYQMDNKENLKIIHPWLLEAYLDLEKRLI
ncbi:MULTISPECIES: bis(5'-nucleosyl)-tetraphosphatase (symmetrical) YqeK [unclassified Clostridium]|uniref:bis(5'-nucleosyl)-tetraphosphatase (symmetrical) YqeK n=1 Tax=unclassified Clostridium TaxID=2614128 RepID=UPI0025B87AD3|nr:MULTISPECIES: bis(5'-nucleosyl)-tetraphosphatase (symmetrical) YqeK [unclassified Clostridium]